MPYYEKKNLLRRISGMSEVDIRRAERRIRMTHSAMDGEGEEVFWQASSGVGSSVGGAGKEERMRINIHRVKSVEALQRAEDGDEDGY